MCCWTGAQIADFYEPTLSFCGCRAQLKMLFFKSDSKWGVNKMSTVLALALLLSVSLQILTWNGRLSLIQLPPSLVHDVPGDLPVHEQNSTGNLLCTSDEAHVVEHSTESTRESSTAGTLPPNTYFPESDSDIWHCKQHHVDVESYGDWLTGNFTDEQALCAAHRRAKRPMAAGTPRIAFLFLTRGPMPMEPVWRRFFAGHEAQFSLYVSVTNRGFEYPRHSLFHNRTIPSKPTEDKMTINLPESLRHLLAYALLDAKVPNAWFHLVDESTIPIRRFSYVYSHVLNSRQSFVEAFYPTSLWWRANWNTTGDMAIPDRFMRKGEFWVTLHRRHAGMVAGDHYVFPRFKHHWYRWGLSCEIYIPTLMAFADPEGIANHSLVYVNWLNHTEGNSSPLEFNTTNLTPSGIRSIQNLTSNAYGFYHIDKQWDDDTESSCVYNGVPNSPCFLFARKVLGEDLVVKKLLKLSAVLGY